MNNFKKMLEEALDVQTVYDVLDLLSGNPKVKKYYNSGAQYDDEIYSDIPLPLFLKITGLKKEHIPTINSATGDYEASINFTKNKVSIFGGT